MNKNPTRTLGIEKKWKAQFNVRYRKLKGAINRYFLEAVPILNFEFNYSDKAITEFVAFLDSEIKDKIYDNITDPQMFWQNEYLNRTYTRGVNQANVNIKKAYKGDLDTVNLRGGAIPSLSTGVISPVGSTGIHLDALQILYTRDYSELQGITNEMSRQIARELSQGVELGTGLKDLAARINDRVDKIGLSRSKLLAQTETIRAYNIGALNEGQQDEEIIGEKVLYEWSTAGDDRVRDSHRARDGKFYERETAYSLIGEIRCRCALIATPESAITPQVKKENTKERKKLQKL